MKLYVVYDRVSGSYGLPVAMANDGVAVRAFNHQQETAPFAQDMELYCVGGYDESLAFVAGLDKPEFVCRYEPPKDVGGVK